MREAYRAVSISYLRRMQRANDMRIQAKFVRFHGNMYGCDSIEFNRARVRANELERTSELLRKIRD